MYRNVPAPLDLEASIPFFAYLESFKECFDKVPCISIVLGFFWLIRSLAASTQSVCRLAFLFPLTQSRNYTHVITLFLNLYMYTKARAFISQFTVVIW